MSATGHRDLPREGRIYRAPGGEPLIYVRTETRAGTTEALFVSAKDRVVFTRWLPVPEDASWPELELIHNPNADRDIRAMLAEMEAVERKAAIEVGALKAAMQLAIRVVPLDVAADLRGAYVKAKGELLTAGGSAA